MSFVALIVSTWCACRGPARGRYLVRVAWHRSLHRHELPLYWGPAGGRYLIRVAHDIDCCTAGRRPECWSFRSLMVEGVHESGAAVCAPPPMLVRNCCRGRWCSMDLLWSIRWRDTFKYVNSYVFLWWYVKSIHSSYNCIYTAGTSYYMAATLSKFRVVQPHLPHTIVQLVQFSIFQEHYLPISANIKWCICVYMD